MSYYTVEALQEGAYRITSRENVFADLFVGSSRALLWDTGYGFGDLPAAVSQITKLPLTVVNSHGHPDHSCGNFRFPGPVYLHPDDFSLFHSFNTVPARQAALDGAAHFYNWALQKEVSLLPPGLDHAAYASAPSPALLPVSEGQVFDLGGIQLEVVALPGHTGGSIGLFWRKAGLLYVGDAIAGFLFLFLPEAKPLSVYQATLEKAAALPFTHMIPAHGQAPIPRAMLSSYRRCADELDYAGGLPFRPMPGMADVPGTRVCVLDNGSLDCFGQADFVSIVIDPSHMH